MTNPAAEFLDADQRGPGEWRFCTDGSLHGAFGGVFGGALGACCVTAARDLAPDRRPAALDLRFLRAAPAGILTAHAAVVHEGRSLSAVAVELRDERDRLTTAAAVSLVEPRALHPLDVEGERPDLGAYEQARPWRPPGGVEIPIVSALGLREGGLDRGGAVTWLRSPWGPEGASAETACLGADVAVGPPVARAVARQWVPHPNPDLAVRFVGEVTGRDLAGVGWLEGVAGGLAAVRFEVWSEGRLAAVGACTSMLLAR